MITLRKLKSLPADTRLRKIVRLLDGFVEYSTLPDSGYLGGLFAMIRESVPGPELDAAVAATAARESGVNSGTPASGADAGELLRAVDDLRHALRAGLGIPAGDWDLLPPAGFGVPGDMGRAGAGGAAGDGGVAPLAVYLESIRSPFNAGSIIRSAAALGVRRVGMSPDCPPEDHPRLLRSARGAERFVEIVRIPVTELDASWRPLVALEVGGVAVHEFAFPERGTLLVGSEELGLSSAALSAADGTVGIDMPGFKGSLNVGVACGIALHAWCVTRKKSDLSGKTERDA